MADLQSQHAAQIFRRNPQRSDTEQIGNYGDMGEFGGAALQNAQKLGTVDARHRDQSMTDAERARQAGSEEQRSDHGDSGVFAELVRVVIETSDRFEPQGRLRLERVEHQSGSAARAENEHGDSPPGFSGKARAQQGPVQRNENAEQRAGGEKRATRVAFGLRE